MSQIRFFTDEDVYAAIAIGLRKAGFDAIATPEAGRLGEPDESQLEYATVENRVLITFNVGHFAHLNAQWLAAGKHHSGIVVSSQRPIGDLLRRLLNLARTLQAEEMRDRLEFASDWPA
jgi:hypothetical protein